MIDTDRTTEVGTTTTTGSQPIGTLAHLGLGADPLDERTRHAHAADAAVHPVIDEAS